MYGKFDTYGVHDDTPEQKITLLFALINANNPSDYDTIVALFPPTVGLVSEDPPYNSRISIRIDMTGDDDGKLERMLEFMTAAVANDLVAWQDGLYGSFATAQDFIDAINAELV